MIITTNIMMGNTSQCTEYVDHEDDNGTDLSASPEITVKMTMIMMMMIMMMMAPISQPRDHGATVGETCSEQTTGLRRQEMVEHGPGDITLIRSFFINCDDHGDG